MISIVELLEIKGLDCSKKIKIVRHQDNRYDIEEMYSLGQIPVYQSYQAKPIFECDYIVSFIGLSESLARMVGVFRVNGRTAAREAPFPLDFSYQDTIGPNDVFYDLVEVSGFEDLKDRVVIDWGKGALAWHQWLSDKEIVEILPPGYVKDFPGFQDLHLTYDELVAIFSNPTANREWHRALSSVAGIYLIVDSATGAQYVGSAYGDSGILGRWFTYTKTSGHGGNIKLKEIVSESPSGPKAFRFSILRTLPKILTMAEVVRYEAQYKEKLGTRAFGLNLN